MLSKCTLATAGLKSQILNNVDPDPALAGITVTGGRLNVDRAIRGCAAPPAPDFTLSSTPTSQSVTPGQGTTYTVNINRTGGFAGSVSFSVSGLPAGASGSFAPNPATGASSTLSVRPARAPTGSFALTITGVSGSLPRTTQATLVVGSPDFSLSMTPTSQTVIPGQSTTYTVNINRTGGFAGSVSLSASGLPAGASASGLPAGASASFSPNAVTGTSSSLTVTTSATTPPGTFALTITGASGSLTRTTQATLVVSGDNCSNC